jgi:hypothetical protein
VRTIERRLSAIAWNCAQRGRPLDRADRHIAEVMSGIRRRHGRPPNQKEAVFANASHGGKQESPWAVANAAAAVARRGDHHRSRVPIRSRKKHQQRCRNGRATIG